MAENEPKTHTITFPSSVEYLEKVESMSSEIAQEAGFNESLIDDISIALTELVNNAIHHGNQDDKAKKVTVNFYVYSDHIVIGIRDEGQGFKPDEINDPLHPDNIMSESGRGIYLVKALMDSLEYQITENGTEVFISKNK